MIVVGLVLIESHIAVLVGVYAARVVASTVFLHVGFGRIVPRHVCLLSSVECDELHDSVVGEVSTLQEIRVEF